LFYYNPIFDPKYT